MTIRESIKEVQNELSKGNLMPERAADLLMQLAALLGNINERILECDLSYNRILLKALDSEESANRARIVANTSQEYEDMREAKNTREVTLEMIRSLKYLLKSLEDERRNSKF